MPDDNLDVPFPLRGTDVSVPYGDQPDKTTPVGKNVRAIDPLLERYRGGSRHGLVKYPPAQLPNGAQPTQYLGQIVICIPGNVLANWEDYNPNFVTDPTTVGGVTANPFRQLPPGGWGYTPVLGWPLQTRRRVQIVAASPVKVIGSADALTVTLFQLQALSTIAAQTITLHTLPPGRSGDGQTANTNGSGVVTFSVSEASFQGPVLYYASNEYTIAGITFPLVARGMAQIIWTEDAQIALSSPDGTTLPNDGAPHNLVATLTTVSTSAPIAGRTIRLRTDPTGEVGAGSTGVSDVNGNVTFVVSDTQNETVTYAADLIPTTPTPSYVTAALAIQWGTNLAFVQKAQGGGGAQAGTSVTDTITFGSNVTLGHLIVVGYEYGDGVNNGSAVSSITDTVGTVYSQAVFRYVNNDTTQSVIRLFWGLAAGTGANTVSVQTTVPPTGLNSRTIYALEYKNAAASGNLLATNSAQATTINGSNSESPGTVTPQSGGLVVGMHFCAGAVTSGTAIGGPGTLTERFTTIYAFTDCLGCSNLSTYSGIQYSTLTALKYVGITAAFK